MLASTHPMVLATIVTIVVYFLLAGLALKGFPTKFSVRRVSIYNLRVGGIYLETRLPGSVTVVVRVEAVQLAVQLVRALASWFEERPLRLLIEGPEVAIDRPEVHHICTVN